MSDPIPKTREVTDYYVICEKCGKEELAISNKPQELCRECREKQAKTAAYKEIAFMKGATVTNITLQSHYANEIESINILTPDGRSIKLEVERFNTGHHIEWYDSDE